MNLIFRLIYTFLFYRFRSKVGQLGPCRTPFRCLPNDLDLLMHMNNGRYFTIMDVARIDLMFRSGLIKTINRNGWYPVVVAETGQFKKSLQPFQKFEVETTIVGWDDKAVLLGQKFWSRDELVFDAVVRARFLKKSGGSVSINELLEATGIKDMRPILEPWIKNWNQQVQT